MKAPAFQFYVKDWLCSRRVLSMSGDSVKAYMYLLCESWLSIPRATLPNNDKDLAQIARVSDDTWNTIKADVMQHFKIGECTEHKGYLYNEKLLEISRNYEKNQRPNNKNAKRTRINHETYAKKRTASASAIAFASSSTIAQKEKKERMHRFHESPYFEFQAFREKLPEWDDSKCRTYHEKASLYSDSKGAKYLNWIAAVKNWERKDSEKNVVDKNMSRPAWKRGVLG